MNNIVISGIILLFGIIAWFINNTMNYTIPFYVGGKSEKKESYIKEEFPYRKYELEALVKEKLETLLEASPVIYYNKKWTLPEGKVNKKIPNNVYYLSSIVISPSLPNHWEYDKIIDYYSEYARIKTPGYGEKHSVYEYWNNKELHNRWKKDTGDNRELLYENIVEARPAYISVCISLYKALANMNKALTDNNIILDISAYGERAIAAANLGYEYHGVDPNYDLIHGHSKIVMDIKMIKECNINFYYVGLENFKSTKKFSIITYSPPPFNTEPYSGNKEEQSYEKYPTFIEYFSCFLTELIYKAANLIIEDGIFSFTALDRNPRSFPLNMKIYKDKKYISDNTELIYVEALLLVTSCLGFEYKGAIGLSVGNKPAQVPWWTFSYTNTFDPFHLQLLHDNYKEIFNHIGSRILTNYINIDNHIVNDIIKKYIYITKQEKFNISLFYVNTNKTYEQRVFIELCRLRIQSYVCMNISHITKIAYNKIKTIMGRYLMLRSISGTYDKPWLSNLYVDPMFPTTCNDRELINEIHNNVIKNLKEQGCVNADYIVNEYIYWFNSYQVIGIENLYNIIAHYILTIPLTGIELTIKKIFPDKLKILGNQRSIDVLKNIPGTSSISSLFLDTRVDIDITKDINILSFIRYETLSARGHQYTRSNERTEIIEQIIGEKIIDIYASIYNNQSVNYCSIYPDVEENSYGSAFQLHMKEGAYLANPVDVPIFIEQAIDRILKDLEIAENKNKKITVSMAFTVWLDTNTNFIDDFNTAAKQNNVSQIKKILDGTDNTGLKLLSISKYIKIVYILNNNKFPSMIKGEKNTTHSVNYGGSHSRDTVSVGIILCSLPNSILNNHYIIKLVEDDNKYIIF